MQKQRLEAIKTRIQKAALRFEAGPDEITLVAVTKTFSQEEITPLLDAGQRIFGENRVQEAAGKWPEMMENYDGIELHLIGPLQSNKVGDAVALFDVIETLDREKLALALVKEQKKTRKTLDYFIQVNIGNEPQKSGVPIADTEDFVRRCTQYHGLNVIGLMCIPPEGHAPGPYFAQLNILAKRANLKYLSMGMSADFETAIAMGASHVRIGSALFGTRDT